MERYVSKKKLQEKMGLSATEAYFKEVVEETLKDDVKILTFMSYIHDAYGDIEWWAEWLGYSERDIKKNIIEVFRSI